MNDIIRVLKEQKSVNQEYMPQSIFQKRSQKKIFLVKQRFYEEKNIKINGEFIIYINVTSMIIIAPKGGRERRYIEVKFIYFTRIKYSKVCCDKMYVSYEVRK